jgi:hypothetical protein
MWGGQRSYSKEIEMRLRTILVAGIAIALIVAAACGDDDDDVVTPTDTPVAVATGLPGATATPDAGDPSDAAVRAATEALFTWLGPVGELSVVRVITLTSVEAVTWSNGCLDVGRAGVACTEALVEGYRIELALGDAIYEVRTDAVGDVVVWAPSVQILVRFSEASTNSAVFTTDDGGKIETQPVPGTSYGVELASLVEGDAVGIALADAPQGGGVLLVWVDPVFE